MPWVLSKVDTEMSLIRTLNFRTSIKYDETSLTSANQLLYFYHNNYIQLHFNHTIRIHFPLHNHNYTLQSGFIDITIQLRQLFRQ